MPVTVKCRIGVDEQEPEVALPDLLDRVLDAGADAIWIHARKAWLKGLSPKENREIPPLDYDIVYRIKQARPDVFIGINGGIQTLDQAAEHLAMSTASCSGGRPTRMPACLPMSTTGSSARRRRTGLGRAARSDDGLCRAPHRGRRPAAAGGAAYGRAVHRPARGAALPADPVDRCGEGRGRAGGDRGGVCGGGFFRAWRRRRSGPEGFPAITRPPQRKTAPLAERRSSLPKQRN
jgi:hypothetical protein